MDNVGGLINIIAEYAKKNPVRFHMPGHKGRQICPDRESGLGEYNINYFNFLNYQNDVTELFFTDNLYSPDSNAGLIEGLEKRISECFFENTNHSRNIISYISCGGATLGIQAEMIYI
jgi:arginine/lysine/ornithine decarboxylase